ANWEDEGFPGYDGYAWYRKRFGAPSEWKDKTLYLHLGHVDDVDEVYVNGHLIGFSGGFPPGYVTAYDVNREYLLPVSFLNFSGDNVIAVRVYDEKLGGGINYGKVGIFEDAAALRADVPLPSVWKFMTGDNIEWKDPAFDDSRWKQIAVPAFWETQGFKDYDGFGWYRTRFAVPPRLRQERLIMMLGKIDDLDEVYLNGERIGKTGRITSAQKNISFSDEYQEIRAYTIPSDLIREGKENIIAVRVYDGFKDGGIYRGPIGIVTRDHYRTWETSQRKKKGWDFIDFFLR
ncbi:MAG: hypothetical protein HW407_1371, partial [Bacteroidetes bacterium]|nr:hypothetical protein [Bacteroidota bacterium]